MLYEPGVKGTAFMCVASIADLALSTKTLTQSGVLANLNAKLSVFDVALETAKSIGLAIFVVFSRI